MRQGRLETYFHGVPAFFRNGSLWLRTASYTLSKPLPSSPASASARTAMPTLYPTYGFLLATVINGATVTRNSKVPTDDRCGEGWIPSGAIEAGVNAVNPHIAASLRDTKFDPEYLVVKEITLATEKRRFSLVLANARHPNSPLVLFEAKTDKFGVMSV